MLFAFCALFGNIPLVQANQLTQILRDSIAVPLGWVSSPDEAWHFNLAVGVGIACLVGAVILGGIQRIGRVASKVVPAMVVLYLGAAWWILALHWQELPGVVGLILRDAFTGQAVAGGAVWAVVVTGIRRAAFSNEAGIGTEVLAHGAAKTNEPVREGLVAMLGPLIDTVIVCSATALIILSTGTWQDTSSSGVTVTAAAFEQALPSVGTMVLVVCVFFFATTTMLSMSYYGEKSAGFLIGAQHQRHYRYFYLAAAVAGAVGSLDAVVNFIDGTFALMAIPTMTSALLLSPRAMQEARRYFRSLAAA